MATDRICLRAAEIATLQEQIKVANHRITDIEKTQEELKEMNGNIKLLVYELKDVTKIAINNQQEIKEMKEKPVKELNAYKIAIFTAIIGTIAGALIGKVM